MVGLTGESSMYGREAMIREAEDRVTFTAEEVRNILHNPYLQDKGSIWDRFNAAIRQKAIRMIE